MKAKFTEVLIVLLCATAANAAELQPRTVKAWHEYVQAKNERMQQRLHPGAHFLWIDERPDRAEAVRGGEILVSPLGPHNPKKVPSGLIHDWIGVEFIPNATIAEILSVVRDYGDYKQFYRPTVIDSKTVQTKGIRDRFSMLLMNKALFLRTALDSEYEAAYFQVNQRQCYSLAHTIYLREIQHYGEPGARSLREDQGSGLIWRLASITRLEERDGGVYLELEAMALSRDVPGSLRWLVNPIVRRVSRDSLTTSLRETRHAVQSTAELTAQDSHSSRSERAAFNSAETSSANPSFGIRSIRSAARSSGPASKPGALESSMPLW
jgi:hypothetical protein